MMPFILVTGAYDSDGKLSVPVTAGVATATGIAIVALVFLIEHIRRKYQGTPTEAEEQETKYDRTVPDKYFIDPNEDTELPMKLL